MNELLKEARKATSCRCVDAPEQDCGSHGDSWSRMIGSLADALEVAEAKNARLEAAPEPGKRLSHECRADLIHIAAGAIQSVWDDVPAGVTADVLASNVVMAQEFAWIARGFPVESEGTDAAE